MKKICVPTSITSPFQEFFDNEGIAVEIVTGRQFDVKVVQCNNQRESNLDTIFSGGWITCGMARSLAKKMKIPLDQMGKMLNHLDIKIRKCSLGCFK